VDAFADAVRPSGGKVLAGDVDPLAPSLYLADRAVRLPPVSDSGYIEWLLSQVDQHRIDLIVPTIDAELEVLARHRLAFEELGCVLLVSSVGLIEVTRDKFDTVSVFDGKGIRTPASWLPTDLADANLPPRLFIKPRRGSASQHAYNADRHSLDALLTIVPDPMVQELVEAPEVTIDALLDLEGRLVHYVPRLRIRTLAGESIQGVTIPDKPFRHWLTLLLELVSEMGGIGPFTVQIFLTEPEPTLSEINPRFGGGFPLANAAGGRYPEWIVAAVQGQPIEPCLGAYRSGLYMTRAYCETFVEKTLW
jgi:carbamoyl-phosphate synthase large subunit